ncbi:hypothetical protein C943_00625 [Mariniradius saccharolyticus AK6]|uniref:Uncharacterized protein n=1 Tax=Mariniradius saccharolyticus AK6 TaxID=1239962 RepID=M7XXZ5_9BACT|nr:hypothetical protein C943_00625 [Mariniradius saccharolyticus AK6]
MGVFFASSPLPFLKSEGAGDAGSTLGDAWAKLFFLNPPVPKPPS